VFAAKVYCRFTIPKNDIHKPNNHEYINYQEVPSLLRVRSMAMSS